MSIRHWLQIVEVALQEGTWEYARSSGPGGQHVNKTESKATWRWSLSRSAIFEEEKSVLRSRLGKKLSRDGDIFISCGEYRERRRNREACYDKIIKLFEKAFYLPPVRKKTKPTKASKTKRLEAKKRRGQLKASRQKKDWQ